MFPTAIVQTARAVLPLEALSEGKWTPQWHIFACTALRLEAWRKEKQSFRPFFSSNIQLPSTSRSLYGKGISCPNKGGNAARWQLGKFHRQTGRKETKVRTLPRRRTRPNHCSTSLAGECLAVVATCFKNKIHFIAHWNVSRKRETLHRCFESFTSHLLESVWC